MSREVKERTDDDSSVSDGADGYVVLTFPQPGKKQLAGEK